MIAFASASLSKDTTCEARWWLVLVWSGKFQIQVSKWIDV